jgi:hypothetical protein
MPAPDVVTELTQTVDGPVLRPGTSPYDEARSYASSLEPASISCGNLNYGSEEISERERAAYFNHNLPASRTRGTGESDGHSR